MESLDLCAYWYNRPLSGLEYLARVKMFLIELGERFPEFARLYVVSSSGTGTEPVAPDFHGFEQQVAAHLPKDWAYVNPNPSDKTFDTDSRSSLGFSSSFSTAQIGGDSPCIVEVACGKLDPRSVNSVIIRLPATMEKSDFVVGLFKEVLTFWAPSHGSVSRPAFDDALDQPVGDIRVGWLTFLPRTDAAAHVSVGRLEECCGGLLVRLSEHIPSARDGEALRSLFALKAGLETAGLLRNPRDS